MYFLFFLLSAGLNLLLGAKQWSYVLAGNLQDPDSYMRLVRIQQGLQAGHLLNTVAGDQSGAGVMVEWSHFLDLILLALAAPLAPVLGWHQALFWAGVASGPLGVGVLGALLAWAVEPLSLRRTLWAAPVAAGLLPGVLTIALPGVVHYHVALLALIVLTAGWSVRAWFDDLGAGFMAGISGALAIWMTPETMPFVLASYVPLLVRLWQVNNAKVIAATAAGLFDLLVFVGVFDSPQGGIFAPQIDRLSMVYVVMATLFLLVSLVLLRFGAQLGRRRGAAGWTLMALALGVWVAAYPAVAEGPAGLLPHSETQALFGVITEQMALTPAQMLLFLPPGLLALGYALWRGFGPVPREDDFLTPRRDGTGRTLWLWVAVVAAVSVVLAARYELFTGFAAVLAAALLPVALSDANRRLPPATASLARIVALALVLVLPEAGEAWPSPAAAPIAAKVWPSCSLHNVAPLLLAAAKQVVLAPPEDAPELFYRTQVFTVGSLYTHGIAGFMRDRAAWRVAPEAAVPPDFTAAKAGWVLFCPSPGRYPLVADLPTSTTLWDALEANAPPAWLTPAGSDAEGWHLYRVTP